MNWEMRGWALRRRGVGAGRRGSKLGDSGWKKEKFREKIDASMVVEGRKWVGYERECKVPF